jgi:hypothetical protein
VYKVYVCHCQPTRLRVIRTYAQIYTYIMCVCVCVRGDDGFLQGSKAEEGILTGRRWDNRRGYDDERNALSFPFRAVPLFPLKVSPRQTKEGDGGFSRERGQLVSQIYMDAMKEGGGRSCTTT